MKGNISKQISVKVTLLLSVSVLLGTDQHLILYNMATVMAKFLGQ